MEAPTLLAPPSVSLASAFRATRKLSLDLAAPLSPEDFRIQSMPDVSPPWWNLGHTSWFFAKNVLEPAGRAAPEDARLEYVLNSYYESLGPRLPRPERGLITRPTTAEILAYRESVDRRMEALLDGGEIPETVAEVVRTGIQHEQQHQELLVTEVKHIYSTNPRGLREPYRPVPAAEGGAAGVGALAWRPFAGGLERFGAVEGGWAWDNELPVHQAWLDPFALADRLVTCGEYLQFIADGGYDRPLLWLANGWAQVAAKGWKAPLYWWREGGDWWLWTLAGERRVDPAEPVCHVSFYEADAYARWRAESDPACRDARLPTEREWEHAARAGGFHPETANLLGSGRLHPYPAAPAAPPAEPGGLAQMAGDVWEWTSSHYEPYPGYRPFAGALMEYNGKFMDNQRVLRGGSCATPEGHVRPSYRNFWPAETRFQFTGVRLARALG